MPILVPTAASSGLGAGIFLFGRTFTSKLSFMLGAQAYGAIDGLRHSSLCANGALD